MRRLSRREWLAATGIGVAAWRPERAWGKENDLDEMIEIPPGAFLMGILHSQAEALARKYRHHVSWLSGEVPQRTVELPAYRIDKYPVTNAQYAVFCKETGYPPRPHWGGPEPPRGLLHHPVTYVNKADAETYAGWAGKRLPTEAQWEKAARGAEGRMYPWGDGFDGTVCRWDGGAGKGASGTAPVTQFPRGASPYGVMDMAGNAAEWCADGPGPGSAFIKGGCWLTTQPINLRPAARNMSGFANNASAFYGFRCVKEVA